MSTILLFTLADLIAVTVNKLGTTRLRPDHVKRLAPAKCCYYSAPVQNELADNLVLVILGLPYTEGDNYVG